jgi:hypothetical protein
MNVKQILQQLYQLPISDQRTIITALELNLVEREYDALYVDDGSSDTSCQS